MAVDGARATARRVTPHGVLAYALLAVAVSTTAALAFSTFTRAPGTSVPWADLWAYNLAHAAAALLCLLRAARVRAERWAWVALGAGLVATTVGNVWYTTVLAVLPRVPYPSVADWLWLGYFPLTYVGLVLLVRTEVRRFHLSMWLDGIVAALGVSALAGALVFDDLIGLAGGRMVAVVVNLAYPVGDLLLLVMVAAAIALLGLRCGPRWWLLAAGLLVQAFADSAYAVMLAAGTYADGSRLDALWPLGALLVGAGAMVVGRSEAEKHHAWWTTVLVPGLSAVASVALLAWSLVTPLAPWVGALAIGTVVAAGARATLTFREVATLAETRREARTDELTGLANRRAFHAGLETSLRLRRGQNIAVLLIDLDRFKEVNDALGHHTGDELLRLVGARLAGCVRDRDLLARLGGDEFAIVLTAGADVARAEAVARRVAAAMTAPFDLPDISLHVGVSLGIALCPDHATEASTLLQQADVAMYEAKAAGGGHRLYCSGNDPHSRARLQTIEDLRVAIARGELVLHYQPKMDLRLGTVIGVEALVRWQHPERGLLVPDTFLPLAEQTGLMRPLTAFVLDEAMRQLRCWHDQGRDDFTVAVNVSASSLMDAGLPAQVAALLERHGLPVESVELEVTESVMMTDPARAQQVVARLDEMGIRVAVDDYGVGHSSLAYLRDLAVRDLKLDRAFVDQVATDHTCEAIVRSTIDLAHSLGLRMVAEGVEDAADAAMLTTLGCDVAQGFLYSRPVAPDALERWLADRDASPSGAATLSVVARA